MRSNRHVPLPMAVLAIVAGVLAATGCGGGSSAADQAKTDACNAKSDINIQVQKLKGLPLTVSSVDTAKTALTKIENDLSTIKNSAPNVSGDLKGQLESANSQFKGQVKQISQSITSAQSLTAAATALTQAGDQLAADYQKAFANVSC